MATAQVNQKVFVSPGVYTSETDLSFVAQSVGVTTLGLVGETLKGPAFEPIFITNYDEFQTFFGGTEPTKFQGTQIPKYEASYIAKSYLQQSNQLFVTRILGLSGYDAGPSWTILAKANVDTSTIGLSSVSGTPWTCTFSGNSTGNTITLTGSLPATVNALLNSQYRLSDGSTSTFNDDFEIYLGQILDTPSSSASTAIVYGSILEADYNSLSSSYSALTNVFNVNSLDLSENVLSDGDNYPWYYSNFSNYSANIYSGFSFDYVVSSLTSAGTGNYSGTISGNVYSYSGTAYSEYNNMVLATLRSRGITNYSSTLHGPQYQVTGTTDLIMNCAGAYSGVSENPFGTFLLSGVTADGDNFSFQSSFALSDSRYLTKVLGVSNFDKNRNEVPIFVEEIYPVELNELYDKGYIRGLSCDMVALPAAVSYNSDSIAWNLEKYQTPLTPFIVSELRGNKVYKLFRFHSISDGTDANTQIKVSIANISFSNLSFDILVRDFFDTDQNPVVIEKFTNCTMDPASNSFVGKKIGSFDGEYPLVSTYIMVELSTEAPIDALPCGFYGYDQRVYDTISNPSPVPIYKTQYNFPGEVIYNPPFGISAAGATLDESAGDNVRRTYLGFSTRIGTDLSFLQYKGKRNPSAATWGVATDSEPWNYLTKGFHMDSGATVVTIGSEYVTSGETAFDCGDAEFRAEIETQENPYYYIYSRKFTICFAGGFDGWDIYRDYRTNEDRFRLGASGYLAGAAPSTRYPSASGEGMFKRIIVDKNTQDFANTDYYAYLLGILSFQNPESTNINVFATSSIDYVNNPKLVESAINMIQFSRADSVYICTTPDYPMYTTDTNNSDLIIYPQEAVDNLDNSAIDSNYTATYYPWILVRDTVNNTQLYLPPTGEVCRNLALTDNIAFPWFASAGYTRGLVNSVKARLKLTQEDRDTLYQGRINPIATFSDVGTVIWGNKTLQVADSALNRLNVRRLLLQARKLISAVAVRLLFEQNDQIVRQQFLDSVNPILDGIRRDRGLYDFRVTVSSSPEDLDRNTLTGRIYLKPTKALEFIEIEFFITPTGASFENI